MKKTPLIIGGIAITSAFFIKLFYALSIFFIGLFIIRQISVYKIKKQQKKSLWYNEDNELW